MIGAHRQVFDLTRKTHFLRETSLYRPTSSFLNIQMAKFLCTCSGCKTLGWYDDNGEEQVGQWVSQRTFNSHKEKDELNDPEAAVILSFGRDDHRFETLTARPRDNDDGNGNGDDGVFRGFSSDVSKCWSKRCSV